MLMKWQILENKVVARLLTFALSKTFFQDLSEWENYVIRYAALSGWLDRRQSVAGNTEPFEDSEGSPNFQTQTCPAIRKAQLSQHSDKSCEMKASGTGRVTVTYRVQNGSPLCSSNVLFTWIFLLLRDLSFVLDCAIGADCCFFINRSSVDVIVMKVTEQAVSYAAMQNVRLPR